MAQKRQLVTLLTDFGTTDYFVGAMKGAAFSIHPDIEFVDITHEIPSHDIFGAAYTLRCVYDAFPRFTTHVVVVDPGVGSARRPILVMTDTANFVGPDNGVFSYIYQVDQVNRVFHLNVDHYFRKPVSNTFHGRDVFAPAAAQLALGATLETLGAVADAPVIRRTPEATRRDDGAVQGEVITVDRFGNAVTNLLAMRGGQVQVNGFSLVLRRTYADVAQGEPLALVGSSGLVEIAVRDGSAAEQLGLRRGSGVALLPLR